MARARRVLCLLWLGASLAVVLLAAAIQNGKPQTGGHWNCGGALPLSLLATAVGEEEP